jgi:putative ABC transport system permease protein
MNLITLAWKNVLYKPLSMLMSLVLFALGTGLIALLLLMQRQLQENFERNLAGIDLVIGAKGSPLQLILSSMYHVDSPTGNISLKEIRPFLNPKHPLIGTAVPMSLGDSYKGYRIVGTTHAFIELYKPEIQTGRAWEQNFEVTIGDLVARSLGLKIGDEFRSTHGFEEGVDVGHVDHLSFKVVGTFKAQGTVVDQLILTTNQSYWLVHGESDHDEHSEEEDSTHVDHSAHDPESDHAHDEASQEHDGDHSHETDAHVHAAPASGPLDLLDEDETLDITSLLITFKARNFQALNMQRSINENTDMQAATPAIEINRLYSLMGTGERVLRLLAWAITIVSGLSVFISLFSSLRDRRYELALMRVMGAGRGKLFVLIILEGLLLAGIGCLAGLLLSHGAMEVLGGSMEESYRYHFTGLRFLYEEIWLVLGALGIGFVAAVIPAWQASRTDIATTLTEG